MCWVRPHAGHDVHTDLSGTMVPGWVRTSEIRIADSLSAPESGMPPIAGLKPISAGVSQSI